MTEFLTGLSWGLGFGVIVAVVLVVFRSIQQIPEGGDD